MIVEYVQFKYPAGWTREQILEDARPTAVKWRANKELIRKHYIAGENGTGGAFYIWPSKEAGNAGTMQPGAPTSRNAPARRPASPILIS
jgi:hypothetical protein